MHFFIPVGGSRGLIETRTAVMGNMSRMTDCSCPELKRVACQVIDFTQVSDEPRTRAVETLSYAPSSQCSAPAMPVRRPVQK
jgi:hypothetical protein